MEKIPNSLHSEQEQQSSEVLTHEKLFSPEGLNEIALVYGLKDLRYVSSPESGIMTDNGVLEDGDGNKYFAKFYLKQTKEELKSIYRAVELVEDNSDIPVAVPIDSLNGNNCSQVCGRSLVLFPYIESSQREPETKEEELHLMSEMGFNLGKIHSTPFSPEDLKLKPIQRWQPEGAENRIQKLHEIVDYIQDNNLNSEFDALALRSAKTKLDLLDSLPGREDKDEILGICHGDYHRHNVLRDENQNIVSIIDWDNAGLADTYLDLLNTFGTQIIEKHLDDYQAQKEKARAFLAKYQEGLGKEINPERLESAYNLFMHERIGTSWPLNQHYFDNNSRNDNRTEHLLEKAIHYSERYDEVWGFIKEIVNSIDKQSS